VPRDSWWAEGAEGARDKGLQKSPREYPAGRPLSNVMADELRPSFWPGLIPPLHLTVEEIADYLDAVLDLRSRQRIEAHLAICDVCLDEVIAVLRQLQPRALPAED
jgi:hypothetical protein